MTIETINIGPNGDLQTRLRLYFKPLVEKAISKQSFNPRIDSQFYLVNLLASAVRTKNIFMPKAIFNGVEYDEVPIALQYMSAFESDEYNKTGTMKKIGDYTLFKIGFFPKSFSRKSVKIDYYMRMGSSAYSTISWKENDLFYELSRHFPLFCETLWIVSGNDKNKDDLLARINSDEIMH